MRSIDEGQRADMIIAIDKSMDELVERGIVLAEPVSPSPTPSWALA